MGGREGRGKKIMEEIVPPRQSVVRLFFVLVSAKDFSDIFAISKQLAGTHLLDPLLILHPKRTTTHLDICGALIDRVSHAGTIG